MEFTRILIFLQLHLSVLNVTIQESIYKTVIIIAF